MVAKISSGKSLYGALEYNKIKVDTNEAKVILSNNMFDMVDRLFSHSLCQAAFEPYLAANRKTENPIIHISLNPDPKDNLSNEQFAEIAEEYMQRRDMVISPILYLNTATLSESIAISCRFG